MFAAGNVSRRMPIGPNRVAPRYRARWSGVILLILAGCGPGREPEVKPPHADPAARFGALENRLLAARTVRFNFHVTAEGVVEADLRGGLDLASRGGIRLTASGHFAGRPADLQLVSDDGRYEFGDATGRKVAPTPAHLREALIVGVTRMGILHNLARLADAAPPDHADGGVRDWVVLGAFAGDSLAPGSVSFDLSVSGEPAGSASLEIDPRGRPVARRQTVRFPSGEMRVVERYSAVTIEP